MLKKKPVVALVGRPNVGKSTLFNRLIGRRVAIVEDIPGTTRDRIYGDSDWNGVGFIVIDTGGLEAPSEIGAARLRQTDAVPLASASVDFVEPIQNQAQLAMDEADVILFVVDGKQGLTAADVDVADVLRLSEKPLFVVVNKAESNERRLNAVEFWNLGLGEPYAISAYHGDGTGDLMDLIVETLPYFPIEDEEEQHIGLALVGRPNVGKSSLLNALLQHDRAIVSEVPGTTRDPIDTQITFNGEPLVLIDTAGIRRRGSVEAGIEYYSVLRSMRAIDRANVALLLIDGAEGVTAQDTHVAGYVLERYKGIVVIINKWDAVEKDTHTMVAFERQVREDLKFMSYVPVLFISAKTTQRVHRVLPAAMEVVAARRHRLTTSEFNNIIRTAYDSAMPPSRHGRTLRMYYGTQVGTEPPTFVIFVNNPDLVHFSYERYLENQIRAYYPFIGTPIRIYFRQREQREQ